MTRTDPGDRAKMISKIFWKNVEERFPAPTYQ